MSREFGSYENGYFHQQIQQGAKDCLEGNDELTRLWGKFLEEFYEVAYAISTSEAGDSGPYRPIIENLNRMTALQDRLDDIKSFLEIFDDVAKRAVSEYIDSQKK